MSSVTSYSDLDSLQHCSFDYVICGGGTAGCVIARRLASIPYVTVLLVEAGRDSGLAPDVLVPGKYVHQLSADKEGLWELPTVPQKELNGRELVFLRGRQLGGSSAVNYMAMARGPAADYDDWANIVEDKSWRWENVLPLMKELENFRPAPPEGFESFACPDKSVHGVGGPISIGFGDVMVPGAETFIQACKGTGMPTCLDNNSGNPIGVGLAQFNVGGGERSYAATAYLDNDARKALKNLKIVTQTAVDGVIFEGLKATGVVLFDSKSGQAVQVKCHGEVVLCGGTFGSPKILMLSGIGPRDELVEHNIPVVVDLPGCGENMLDHSILTCEYLVDSSVPAHNHIFANPAILAVAEAQYAANKTGPLAVYGTSGIVAFPKIDRLYQCKEFQDLDQSTQKFLAEKTRPSAEIWLGSGPANYEGNINPEDSYLTHELLLQNNLSRGTVKLRSSNPRDLPLINPKFLDHPFDKQIAIETVREAINVAQDPSYGGVIKKMVHGPGKPSVVEDIDKSDETILEFVRANLGQGYHSMSTCRMGPASDPMAVVDNSFAVFGVQGLRVADLSVCPVLTSNHTQINVYLIAEKCAREMVRSWWKRAWNAKL